VGSRPVL